MSALELEARMLEQERERLEAASGIGGMLFALALSAPFWITLAWWCWR